MNRHLVRWSLLLLACTGFAACQDRRDPVKPVATASIVLVVPASA